MRIIQETDVVFRYLTINEARSVENYNDFACFRWDGSDWFAFYMYADNYYNAAYQLLEDAKTNEYYKEYQPCNNIDSIIYPICFLYRHYVELTLKWLYLKYASLDDEGKTAYLKNAKHGLKACWEELKLIIKEKLSKVDCECDVDAIEHYICEWDTFDKEAYRLRYPCTKEERSSSIAGLKLDVIALKEKMESFHDSINYIDGRIENTMYDFGSRSEKSKFWNMYESTKEKIGRFIADLEQSDEKKIIHHPLSRWLSSNEANECIHLFFKGLTSCEKIVVEIIYIVASLSCNWPKNNTHAQQAFLSVCVDQMKKEHFEFGVSVDDKDISFKEKNKRAILSSLRKALIILEKKEE